MESVYQKVKEFKRRYPMTVAWRLRKNANIVERHLNDDEYVTYAFAAQKNNNPFNILATAVVAVTNKRLLIGRDRVVIGYFLDSITPDLFNDLKIKSGVLWGKIYIDTVKEFVALSNIDKGALAEIETKVTGFMMEEKCKYDHSHSHSVDRKTKEKRV